MKILITGCNGQLGSELTGILSEMHSEIGPISEEYRDAQVVAVDVDTLDIADHDAVMCFVRKCEPDLIINCAAMTNVDGCETMLETAYQVNSAGPRNLAMAADAAGAKLVHVSTDYVFAGTGNRPFCEWDSVDPQSVYGKSKALGETYAARFCKETFIVRTSWLYGFQGKNFVKTVRRVLREKGSMTVVNDQRGNPTYANDLAHHILKLAVTDDYGTYHCTGNGECSWYEFAREIAALSGITAPVLPCTSEEYEQATHCPTKRPAYSSLSHLALQCAVGDEMRPWKEALKSFLARLDAAEAQQG